MTNIHWDQLFYVDPATGESTDPSTPGAIGVPTYGNYGGAGYSSGAFGGELITMPSGMPYGYFQLLFFGNAQQDQVDVIDYLSYRHDVASAQSGPGYTAAQAAADATLLNAVAVVDASYDPGASLYAGITSFGMIAALGLHGYLDVLTPFQLLRGLSEAVNDIEFGLNTLPSDERDLALSLIFEPTADPDVFAFDFEITTSTFGEELLERIAMNTLNALMDSGEADEVPLNTGYPFPGTSTYEIAYNAMTGDLDLNAA